MFNLGFTEMLAIAVIALIFIGPKQLPQVARVIGRMLGEFRRATSDFNREIYNAKESFHNQVSDFETKIDINDDLDIHKELEKPIPKQSHEEKDS